MAKKVLDFERGKKAREEARGRHKKPGLYSGLHATVALFLTWLAGLLALVALTAPGFITSSFFAPTLIIISVIGTLGTKRSMVEHTV